MGMAGGMVPRDRFNGRSPDWQSRCLGTQRPGDVGELVPYALPGWNTRSSKVFHLWCYDIKVHYIIHSSCMKMTEFFIDFSTLGLGQSVTETVA